MINCSGLTGQIQGIDLMGQEKYIEIPFTFDRNYILLDVVFEDKINLRFIYDTGASHTILFEKILTDLLDIEYDKAITIRGSDLHADVSALICRNVSLQLKDLDPVKRDILVLEENYLKLNELTGLTIHGIIGASFFQNLVARIDYKKKKLIFCHPNHFELEEENFQAIPIEIRNNKPYLTAKIFHGQSDSLEAELLIDTGASLTFLMHANVIPSLVLPEKVMAANLGIGLGGFLTGYIGKTQRIEMGPFGFDNLLTNYQDVDSSIIMQKGNFREGIIGNSLLARFEVIIDYANQILYLKPHKKYNEAFDYDKSGMFILAFGEKLNQFMISTIVRGSPADLAGLEPGDIIQKVGCWNAKFLGISNITRRLSGKTGKKIKLKIKRGDRTFKVKFQLKDMI